MGEKINAEVAAGFKHFPPEIGIQCRGQLLFQFKVTADCCIALRIQCSAENRHVLGGDRNPRVIKRKVAKGFEGSFRLSQQYFIGYLQVPCFSTVQPLSMQTGFNPAG